MRWHLRFSHSWRREQREQQRSGASLCLRSCLQATAAWRLCSRSRPRMPAMSATLQQARRRRWWQRQLQQQVRTRRLQARWKSSVPLCCAARQRGARRQNAMQRQSSPRRPSRLASMRVCSSCGRAIRAPLSSARLGRCGSRRTELLFSRPPVTRTSWTRQHVRLGKQSGSERQQCSPRRPRL